MTKEKLGNELHYNKIGYKQDFWKWVLILDPLKSSQSGCNDYPSAQDITEEQLWKVYGLEKYPKLFPCTKKCAQVPWCIGGLRGGGAKGGSRMPLSQQPRTDVTMPVGLQNTANTCWINSALQLFYQMPKFRNAINAICDFRGDDSLDSLMHLLQVVFAEMETHPFKAVASDPGSVFERLGMFASNEVMKKDANNELLKCVSEFMENTIDWLLTEPTLMPLIAPMFTISLTRVAKWQCSRCSRLHENQLAPASSYTMGAYISADQTPLQQCLMDLQAETQTGVQMVCGQEGICSPQFGCGATVRVDRVVTPKLASLPIYLIIRNNSLIAEDIKRRLHVVYPERLDLSSHTLTGSPAHYELTGVIFHHGHWVKHYSAQVKCEGGRWFSFNDENVQEMNFKLSSNNQSNPQENHPNYFSLGSVSAKYKSRHGERVSRGAFIWLYTLIEDECISAKAVGPQENVLEYIKQRRNLKRSDNSEKLKETMSERNELLKKLAVTCIEAPFSLLPEWLLLSWLSSQQVHFEPPSHSLAQLADCICEHGRLKPFLAHTFKCIKSETVSDLLSSRSGIHFPLENLRITKSIAENKLEEVVSSSCSSERTSVTFSLNGSYGNGAVNSVPCRESIPSTCKTDNGIQMDSSLQISSSSSPTEFDVDGSCNIPSLFEAQASVRKPVSEDDFVVSSSDGVSDAKPLSTNYLGNNNSIDCCSIDDMPASRAQLTLEGVYAPQCGVPLLTTSSGAVLLGKALQCRECVAKHAQHILFLEHLKELYKICKKNVSKLPMCSMKPIGCQTLELWPKIAARRYLRDRNLDFSCAVDLQHEQTSVEDDISKAKDAETEVKDSLQDKSFSRADSSSAEPASPSSSSCVPDQSSSFTTSKEGLLCDSVSKESTAADSVARENSDVAVSSNVEHFSDDTVGFKEFNEDLVCSHGLLNPLAPKLYLSDQFYDQIETLCVPDLHPATVLSDFELCSFCQNEVEASESACERGLEEKRRLPSLFAEKRRPSLSRDSGISVYLLDRDFLDEWRKYLRSCQKGQLYVRPVLNNEDFLCEHGKLQYNPLLIDEQRRGELWVLLFEEEWTTLEEFYGPPKGGAIQAFLKGSGSCDFSPGVCTEGCVEAQMLSEYEQQFQYESALIYVRQVHSAQDIPQRCIPANTRSMGPATPCSSRVSPPVSCSMSKNKAEAPETLKDAVHRPAVTAQFNSDIEKEKTDEDFRDFGIKSPYLVVNGDVPSMFTAVETCAENSLSGAGITAREKRSREPMEALSVSSCDVPSKMPRLEDDSSTLPLSRTSCRKRKLNLTPGAIPSVTSSSAAKNSNVRLVRASKNFASTDTIRQVQNFIAERTSVWPMLQVLWLTWSPEVAQSLNLPVDEASCGPVLLQEEHLARTLGSLRVREGDTIYFRASKEDMARAAGDGVTEFDEYLPL